MLLPYTSYKRHKPESGTFMLYPNAEGVVNRVARQFIDRGKDEPNRIKESKDIETLDVVLVIVLFWNFPTICRIWFYISTIDDRGWRLKGLKRHS
jgi:hypothetical protein